MRIAHVSDIHIRNLKFHSDYRKVFENFYRELEERKVDLVVNTGDTAHTKTNISPEFVDMASQFFTETAKRAPMINVLGNHDLNLMNEDRQDAITPIIEALNNPQIVLLKKSGPFSPAFDLGRKLSQLEPITFHNLGIADVESWPRPPYDNRFINIGLFHGSIRNCVTDSLFRMTHVEYDHDIFEGLDFVMMGDIHKRQEFNGGRTMYAGSMIQQNFGEDPEKGFLVWDITSRQDWNIEFVELKGNRKFYTVKLPDDLRVPEMGIEPDSRIRISPPRQLTLVEQKTVEKLVKRKYNPHDVITLGVQNIGQMFTEETGGHKIENLRDAAVQENLLRGYLSDKKLKPEVLDKVLELNKKYHAQAEQKDETARGVSWKVLKLGWNNLFNYGEGNIIDFSQIKGLTGIFAPNASGKSSMIDAITIGMFDSNTKEVPKNVHLINDNKDKAVIILELLANNDRYSIQREIERIKVGKRKGEEKEWGKTTLEFNRFDKDGAIENMVAELRPETERKIRRRFGTFEDFMLTSLFAQWDPMDIIMCKETDRKRILFRFLDLDIFEEKAKLSKEDSKVWLDQLADHEESNYETLHDELLEKQVEDQSQLESWEKMKADGADAIELLHQEIEGLSRQIIPVTFSFRKIEPNSITGLEKQIEDAKGKALIHDMEFDALTGDADSAYRAANLDYNAEYVMKQLEKLEELRAALFSVQAGVKEHQRHVDERKKQIALLDKVPCGDQFPDCQFLVNAFTAQKELPDHLKEVIELDSESINLRTEIMKLEPYEAQRAQHLTYSEEYEQLRGKLKIRGLELDNANLMVAKLSAELETAKVELERYEQVKRDLEKNDLIQHEIGELKDKLVDQEKGQKAWENKLAELHQTMGARRTDIERLEKEIAKMKEVRDTCSAYEHFSNAMGKDGIALRVLTQKLPLINEEINKILGSATEFGVYIEYDPEDQSIRLYIQYGQYKSRLLELGSGAEKFLASVAIRSALLSISNLPRSNMFIIDEGFGKLDPQNLESIQRMFDYLKSVFDHVIVISHTDLMKDMVDNMIDITADDEGYAHVEIGG